LDVVRVTAEPEPVTLDLARTALVGVDLQKAFLHPEGYFCRLGRIRAEEVRPLVDRCRRVIAALRPRVRQVVFLRMALSAPVLALRAFAPPVWLKSGTLRALQEHPEWRDLLPLEGCWGAEIIEELRPEAQDVVIPKCGYDGFHGTDLDLVLRAADVRWLVLVGIAGNVCVESTLRRAFHLGYFPLLVGDAVGFLGPGGVEEATVFNVKTFFGWVTTVDAVTEAVRGAG
jgi:ureidoacrylate peracid hydrolase